METILIPSSRQTLWGKPAVANFFLGGSGAGAYVVAAILSGFERAPLLWAASALGPLLVMAGLLAVALEAGRPFRGLYVLRKLSSSWMSRELLFGSIFLLAALLEFVKPAVASRVTATVAAILFALAQGFILGRAKGVAAWSAPVLPPLFVVSGLVAGAGLLLVALPVVGGQTARLTLGTAGLVVMSAVLWAVYLAWPGGSAFRSAGYPRGVPTRKRGSRGWPLRTDHGLLGIFVVGHFLPLLMLALGFSLPAAAPLATALSGVGILLGQLQSKAWLILRAGTLRPITISSLRFGRTT